MMTEIEKLKDIQQRLTQSKRSLKEGNSLKYWMEFGLNKEKRLQQISKIRQLLNLPIDIAAEELIQLQNLYLRNMENNESQKLRTKAQLDKTYQSIQTKHKNKSEESDQKLSLFQGQCQLTPLIPQEEKRYGYTNYTSDVQKVDVAYDRAHQFLDQIYTLIARLPEIDPKNAQSQRVLKETLLWRDYELNIQNIIKETRTVIPILFLAYFVILLFTSSFQHKTTETSINGSGVVGTSAEINNLRTLNYDYSDYGLILMRGLASNTSVLVSLWKWVMIVTVSGLALDFLITFLFYSISIRISVAIRWCGYLRKYCKQTFKK